MIKTPIIVHGFKIIIRHCAVQLVGYGYYPRLKWHKYYVVSYNGKRVDSALSLKRARFIAKQFGAKLFATQIFRKGHS